MTTHYSRTKVTISGNVLEVRRYTYPIKYDALPRIKKSKRPPQARSRKKILDTVLTKARQRARRKVSQLVAANAHFHYDSKGRPYKPVFLTLTYRKNVQSLKIAGKEFNDFIKRLNYEVYGVKTCGLKYLGVKELQKRGAIHFHVIFFNLPYIDKLLLEKIWRNGFTNIKAIRNEANAARYVSKYVSKQADNDLAYYKRKRFFCSKGLHKPIIIRREAAANAVANIVPTSYLSKVGELVQIPQNTMQTNYYQLPQGKTLDDVVDNFDPKIYDIRY